MEGCSSPLGLKSLWFSILGTQTSPKSSLRTWAAQIRSSKQARRLTRFHERTPPHDCSRFPPSPSSDMPASAALRSPAPSSPWRRRVPCRLLHAAECSVLRAAESFAPPRNSAPTVHSGDGLRRLQHVRRPAGRRGARRAKFGQRCPGGERRTDKCGNHHHEHHRWLRRRRARQGDDSTRHSPAWRIGGQGRKEIAMDMKKMVVGCSGTKTWATKGVVQ